MELPNSVGKRGKRIYYSNEEFFPQAFIEILHWENYLVPQVILLSIDFYSIHCCNIEIVEISSHTYVATKSSKNKNYSRNSRNTAEP